MSGARPGPIIERLESRSYLSIVFSAPLEAGGARSPGGIALGDVNKDGIPDVVLAGSSSTAASQAVAVYLGNGDGTFQSPRILQAGNAPFGVWVADFNNDTKPDIVVANAKDATLSMFPGNGDGTFGTPVVSSYGTAPSSNLPVIIANLAVGDINGDGKQDVLVADRFDNRIAVMLNSGGGVFAAGTPIAATAPTHISVGDVNKDGRLDVVFDQGGANPSLSVALGNGDGTFAAPVAALSNDVVSFKLTADLNGDGFPDIVAAPDVARPGGANFPISVLLSNGDGTFRHATDLTVGVTGSIMTGDFDGDGHLDIVSNGGNGTIDFFGGNGDGTFKADSPSHVSFAGEPITALSGDFNHDGKVDLVLAETNATNLADGGGIAVLLNQGVTAGPTPSTLVPTMSGKLPASVVAGQKIKPITQRITLTNTGSTTMTGPVSIALLLSTDQTADASDLTAQSIVKKVNLKPGKKVVVPIHLKALPSNANGTYFLLSQITDTAGAVAAVSSASTITVAPPFIDLSGSFVSVPASASLSGKPAKIALSVTNGGNVSASGNLSISLSASATGSTAPADLSPIATLNKKLNLKSGKSAKLTFHQQIASIPAGSYFLVATLDPANTFNDTNLANNTFVSASAVTVA